MPASIALITGGASGIGAAFARSLASRGYDIIVVDRSREGAEALAKELAGRYSIKVDFVEADLANEADLKRVQAYIAQLEALDLLINNAGFGTTGNFVATNFDRQIDMISVHVLAAVRFCRAALPAMIARGAGSIINICSINAFLRFPETATYSATKAYLLVFSECLEAELAGTGVKVQALCPGQTYTNFTTTPDMQGFDPGRIPPFLWMSADELVNRSLAALELGSGRFIPAWKNHLFVFVFGNRFILKVLAFLRKYGVLELVLKALKKRR
ncbi:MAG: SDR family NAD(P)-dependent oxidoreductase [Verrucomicrobiota bacterium]